VFPRTGQPLVRFDATLASYALKPRRRPVSLVDPNPRPSAPRLSFVALQRSKVQKPFFSPLAERPRRVALRPRKSHPQGLATLSVASALEPLGASFSPRHSWASPFRALLLRGDRGNLSASLLRPCALSRNLLGFGPALRRVDPTAEAVPLFATGWIRSGRGPCSPGPAGLSGSPSAGRIRQVSLPPENPRGVGLSRPSRNGVAAPSGPSQQAARRFPSRDAGLSGLSAARLSHPLRRSGLPRTIFSSRGTPAPCEARVPSLCGRPSLS